MVTNIDDYRDLETVVKNRLGSENIIICGQLSDGEVTTYISPEMSDIVLVYLIQTLTDRRIERLQ